MGRDLRQYARQTNFSLLVGFTLLLFIIGDGLIYIFYGMGAALMGLLCLVSVSGPLALILIALWIIDWVARRSKSV
jgi:hypothetical protein